MIFQIYFLASNKSIGVKNIISLVQYQLDTNERLKVSFIKTITYGTIVDYKFPT